MLGLFLLLAAGLKVHGLSQPGLLHAGLSHLGLSRPVFDGAFLSSPQMQWAVVEAEIVIGCLLLWGRFARLAWLAAISFFLLVGSVSLYVALTGQRYCPACFGVVRVPSWATFGLDAGIVAVLAVCRPPRGERFSRRGAGILAAGAAVLCVAFIVLTSDRAIAALRGQRISVTPVSAILATVAPARGARSRFSSRITPPRRSVLWAPQSRAAAIRHTTCPWRWLPANRARSACRWASPAAPGVFNIHCGFSLTNRHNPS